jgi:hypothetical protein
VAWWFDISSTTLGGYGSNPSFPSIASRGPTNRGANFFLGGTTNGWISQRIGLSDLAAEIDDPGVNYELSGWFGGADTQGDFSALMARFLNATNGMVGSNAIGNVSSSDRLGMTGLSFCGTNGTLPGETRFVEFLLTNVVTSGLNDASADNLSFVVTPKPEAAFAVTVHGPTPSGWQIEFISATNRLYVLERSATLEAWTNLTVPVTGNDGPMILTDTNAPAGQAFYRVARRRP